MNNIKYVVKVKESFKDSFLFNTTSIGTHFCGELVNQYDGNFYFELLNSKALVIIPHKSIEWMAPMKRLNQFSKEHKELSIAIDTNLNKKYSKEWDSFMKG